MAELTLVSPSPRPLQPLVEGALQNELRLLEAGVRRSDLRLQREGPQPHGEHERARVGEGRDDPQMGADPKPIVEGAGDGVTAFGKARSGIGRHVQEAHVQAVDGGPRGRPPWDARCPHGAQPLEPRRTAIVPCKGITGVEMGKPRRPCHLNGGVIGIRIKAV